MKKLAIISCMYKLYRTPHCAQSICHTHSCILSLLVAPLRGPWHKPYWPGRGTCQLETTQSAPVIHQAHFGLSCSFLMFLHYKNLASDLQAVTGWISPKWVFHVIPAEILQSVGSSTSPAKSFHVSPNLQKDTFYRNFKASSGNS